MIEWECPICKCQKWEPSQSISRFAKEDGFGDSDPSACIRLKCHRTHKYYYLVFNKVECLSCANPEFCGEHPKQFKLHIY